MLSFHKFERLNIKAVRSQGGDTFEILESSGKLNSVNNKKLAYFRGLGTGRRSAWISISRLKVGTTGCPGVNKPRCVSSTLVNNTIIGGYRAAEDAEASRLQTQ